jgi:hypothetical protein
MRLLTGIELTEELRNKLTHKEIAKADAFPVSSFSKLMDYISRLSYLNKDHLLFFRGQGDDYTSKGGSSSIYPSIYRGDRLYRDELELRFDLLTSASRRLIDVLQSEKPEGYQDVKRRKYIQWSILQHYEVCQTPLLDVTHSLRVACSFAFLSKSDGDPYLYVFGLPYLTNRISVNSEHDIVNVRLLNICPPDALRPYYQEGYLVGTDDITFDYDSKDELDFNRRLIAKFRLKRNKSFWGMGFRQIPESLLYPKKDWFKDICSSIRVEVEKEGVGPINLGRFLQEWADLENRIMSVARQYQDRVFSFREAIKVLYLKELLPYEIQNRLDDLRKIRNFAVHEPNRLKTEDLTDAYKKVKNLRKEIEIVLSKISDK